MGRLGRLAVFMGSVIVAIVFGLMSLSLLPELAAYTSYVLIILTLINVLANLFQILDYGEGLLPKRNETEVETGKEIFTPLLLDVKTLQQTLGSKKPNTRKVDLSVWNSKSNDFLFLRLKKKTKDSIRSLYQEVENYNALLERLLHKIEGAIGAGLYHFSEGILVPPVDWESDSLDGYSQGFDDQCKRMATDLAPEILAEILVNSTTAKTYSAALATAAYNLLAEGDFRDFSHFARTDDYEELASKAYSISNNFSEKSVKTLLSDKLVTDIKQQTEKILTKAENLQATLEKKIQKIN